ncbi:MAG: FAD:protein FMN transferase [Bacteroidales bacterium]|nr:FAD:protein FMN transferase [Bacteroidales bacterium]
MMKKKVFFYVLVLISLQIFPLNRHLAISQNSYLKISGYTQGTTYHITYQNTLNRNLESEVEKRLRIIDELFSIYNPNSLVSTINKSNKPVKVPLLFENLLKRSFEIYRETHGAFDITVGPLVEAWGFGPSGRKNPSAQQIDSLLTVVGHDKIKLKKHMVIKADGRVRLDFNAVAQGYTVDFLAQYFDSLGIPNYMIEVGGELIAKGVNASGQPWRIGIESPSENNQNQGELIQKIISVTNMAVSTSGNYRKFYVSNGVKYAHTIDPKTGYPARNTLLSVTIVAPNCTDADAYATACMVMGIDKAKQFVKNRPQIGAYFIYSGPKGEYLEFMTENFKALILR